MRNLIDIINEFQMQDVEKMLTVGGGDLPPMPPEDGDPKDDRGDDAEILVFDILWDVPDEELASFPDRVVTSLHDVEEAADPYADEDQTDLMSKIGQWLQATYDSRLSNFDYKLI